ncbi:hypothetical protein NQF87_03175 [Bombella sp. TMW 2.2559]|uniref:Uncharacterized protein n=1 Tax=Bombella dulcis TaxID=2967339 RepID=A0ABT3WA74_9PROT|nr:hypothetical protein [Bombella dulcis]MCX5615981.1 hypothetical protein [Bombella dulcis]
MKISDILEQDSNFPEIRRMDEKRYFLTWNFQILRQNPTTRTLYCSRLDSQFPNDAFGLTLATDDIGAQCTFIPQGENIAPYHIDDIEISFNSNMRVWNLRDKNGLFLCFDSETLSFSREHPSFWEGFIILTRREIDILSHFLNNKWVLPKTQKIVDGKDFKFADVFKIVIDDFDVDMRYQLFKYWNKYNVTLYFSGWKREMLHLYNPAVYITAYNKESIMQQCKMCVVSLRKMGNFTGPIILMTDKDQAYIDNLFESKKEYTDNLIIHNLYPKDFLSFVCSKYEITNKDTFAGYQPLLYLDPDIILNRPLEPMLIRGLSTGKICSPAEEFHPIQTHIPAGSSLFSMDDIPGRFTPGINGGTILFPNTEDDTIRRFVDEIRHEVTNLVFKFGRSFNGWADQEAYNYLAIKTNLVNSNALTPFTAYQGPTHDQRLGLIHFWGFSSDEKVKRMREYMNTLGYHA